MHFHGQRALFDYRFDFTQRVAQSAFY
jgi:hypothetical protein